MDYLTLTGLKCVNDQMIIIILCDTIENVLQYEFVIKQVLNCKANLLEFMDNVPQIHQSDQVINIFILIF